MSEEPTLKPPRKSISVFAKALILITFTAGIVAAVPAIHSAQMLNDLVSAQIKVRAQAATQAVAEAAAAPLRFKKFEKIDEALSALVKSDNLVFTGATVWDAAFSPASSVGAQSGDLLDELRALSQTAIESGSATHSSDGFLWAIPVVMGAESTVVGVVSTAWNPDAELRLLFSEKLRAWSFAAATLFALMLIGAFLLRRWISKPLSQVTVAMEKVSEGDLDTAVPHRGNGDEIGQMARALEEQRIKLVQARELDREAREAEAKAQNAAEEVLRRQKAQQKVVETLSVALNALAGGNLNAVISERFDEDYEALRLDFNRTIDVLKETMRTVRLSADGVQSHTNLISDSSEELARRTESQAATLEETAAALATLTKSVSSTAKGAKQVETIVLEAREDAESSGEVVRSAVDAMTQINENSNQISQIITVIEDITFQTNLLALNAGVEAARAGEAGKGFAVVATEVRALAHRSSEAAREIKSLIGRASSQVEKGVELVNESGSALSQILEQIATISEHVSKIAKHAAEQSDGLNEINDGVSQLDSVTQQNVAMVEEATAATHSLKSDAVALNQLVSRFHANEVGSSDTDGKTWAA